MTWFLQLNSAVIAVKPCLSQDLKASGETILAVLAMVDDLLVGAAYLWVPVHRNSVWIHKMLEFGTNNINSLIS